MEKLNDYVVTLCKIGGTEVTAIRILARSKEDIYGKLDGISQDWKMKSVLRLYEEDFQK